MHPAFLVRDAMTGIKPVTGRSPVLIFPDPACDRIAFSGTDSPVSVTIFNLSGQMVKHVTRANVVDVSDLAPGLYLVGITNLNNGEQRFGKFIRQD